MQITVSSQSRAGTADVLPYQVSGHDVSPQPGAADNTGICWGSCSIHAEKELRIFRASLQKASPHPRPPRRTTPAPSGSPDPPTPTSATAALAGGPGSPTPTNAKSALAGDPGPALFAAR